MAQLSYRLSLGDHPMMVHGQTSSLADMASAVADAQEDMHNYRDSNNNGNYGGAPMEIALTGTHGPPTSYAVGMDPSDTSDMAMAVAAVGAGSGSLLNSHSSLASITGNYFA